MAKKKTTSFLKKMMSVVKNEYASIVSDGIIGDIDGYVDSGCYMLNALLSGSIFDGLARGKRVVLAGESSVGKTYFALSIVREFLDSDPNANVIYFESEGALSKQMIQERGIDASRILMMPIDSIQNYNHEMLVILEEYLSLPESDREPLLFVLDSLGMLTTAKELRDITDGKETKDMTRAGLIKACFRTLTMKLSRAKIPMVITNHTYQTMGLFSSKVMSGGSGILYAGDVILFLSRSKEKHGEQIVGNLIKCKTYKSRLSRENKEAVLNLRYDTGLSKYWGLLPIAMELGIFKKIDKKIVHLATEKKMSEKQIYANAEEYFTPEVLLQIDEYVKQYYNYGVTEFIEENSEESEE